MPLAVTALTMIAGFGLWALCMSFGAVVSGLVVWSVGTQSLLLDPFRHGCDLMCFGPGVSVLDILLGNVQFVGRPRPPPHRRRGQRQKTKERENCLETTWRGGGRVTSKLWNRIDGDYCETNLAVRKRPQRADRSWLWWMSQCSSSWLVTKGCRQTAVERLLNIMHNRESCLAFATVFDRFENM